MKKEVETHKQVVDVYKWVLGTFDIFGTLKKLNLAIKDLMIDT